MTPFFTDSCPIREYTGDGCPVGRCWFHLENGVCPRHGNVREAQELYRRSGKLTPDPRISLERRHGLT